MYTDRFSGLPIHYFDNLPAGKVVARITNDTEAIRELYVTVLAQFFTSAIYITGIYAALVYLRCEAGSHLFIIIANPLWMDEIIPEICFKIQSCHPLTKQ